MDAQLASDRSEGMSPEFGLRRFFHGVLWEWWVSRHSASYTYPSAYAYSHPDANAWPRTSSRDAFSNSDKCTHSYADSRPRAVGGNYAYP